MKLTPCSRARATMRAAVGSSVAPPNIMLPRHSGDTRSPLRPNVRYSMPNPPRLPVSSLHQTRLNAWMTNRAPVSGTALFLSFLIIGCTSIGGGLTAWIRRELVERRGWIDDQQFLANYGLSQMVPGATNVNLAVLSG